MQRRSISVSLVVVAGFLAICSRSPGQGAQAENDDFRPAAAVFEKKTVNEWIKILRQSNDPKARARAAIVVGLSCDERVALGSEKTDWYGVAAARWLSSRAKALSALQDALKDDKEASVRFATAFALNRVCEKDGRAFSADDSMMDALKGALEDTTEMVRYYAATALENIGPGPSSTLAVQSLLFALDDKSSLVRTAAADAAKKIDRQAYDRWLFRYPDVRYRLENPWLPRQLWHPGPKSDAVLLGSSFPRRTPDVG